MKTERGQKATVVSLYPQHNNTDSVIAAAQEIIRAAQRNEVTGLVYATTLCGRPAEEFVAGELEDNTPLAQACAVRILHRLSAA
ncbi:hypothetical protein [Uliginosibacterium sediminicola]|uniref:Uncharacterized protein n=1 Tax=Uliginosibacterium sediminicola TaxID=2024550 RepID=A0ABU9YW22_9RHOO